MDQHAKVLENLLRRRAERQGFKLVKSGRRDPRATDYGKFALKPTEGGDPVGGDGYPFDLYAIDRLLAVGSWNGVKLR
jgi:hypothetical protein